MIRVEKLTPLKQKSNQLLKSQLKFSHNSQMRQGTSTRNGRSQDESQDVGEEAHTPMLAAPNPSLLLGLKEMSDLDSRLSQNNQSTLLQPNVASSPKRTHVVSIESQRTLNRFDSTNHDKVIQILQRSQSNESGWMLPHEAKLLEQRQLQQASVQKLLQARNSLSMNPKRILLDYMNRESQLDQAAKMTHDSQQSEDSQLMNAARQAKTNA